MMNERRLRVGQREAYQSNGTVVIGTVTRISIVNIGDVLSISWSEIDKLWDKHMLIVYVWFDHKEDYMHTSSILRSQSLNFP